MDNRLIPKWNTDLKEKRDNYISMKEKIDSMNRQIAHYDEELNAANSCIRDIYSFCEKIEKLYTESTIDFIKDNIKDKIKKYYVETDNYSDENVKCLIKESTIDVDGIQMNNNAKRVILQPMEEYI